MSNPATERMLANERNHGSHSKRVASALFAIRNISVLAYANGFTLWHYKGGSKVSRADVMGKNYFQSAADMFAIGDMIMVSAGDAAFIVVVTSLEIERVTVTTIG